MSVKFELSSTVYKCVCGYIHIYMYICILICACYILIIVAHMEFVMSGDSSANLCSSRDNRQSHRIAIDARRDRETGKQFDDC